MKEYCVDLDIAKELKENGFHQECNFNYINSSYSTGFEGESIYWYCDNNWELNDLYPNPEYDYTATSTKLDGLIPDFVKIREFGKYRKHAFKKISELLVYSAPISEELIKELPREIKDLNFEYFYHLKIEQSPIHDEMFVISYGITNQDRGWMQQYHTEDKKLSNALAKMWVKLKKEGYIHEVQRR